MTDLNTDVLMNEIVAIRAQNNRDIAADTTARNALNEGSRGRQAELTQMGYSNALKLLDPSVRSWLTNELNNVGLSVPASDDSLLRVIAKWQLGELKDGGWKVRNRRDERMGRLYTIFYADPDTWKAETLAKDILAHPGMFNGIEKKAKEKNADPDLAKKQARWREAVRNSAGIGAFNVPGLESKEGGEFRLALVSIKNGEVVVHDFIDAAESMVEREATKYAAKEYPNIEQRRLETLTSEQAA